MDQPVAFAPAPELLIFPDPYLGNPIIRDFLILRSQRNGGVESEVPTPIDNPSSCLSDSFLLSQDSVLSLGHTRPPPRDESPDSDPIVEPNGQALGGSLPSAEFAPILNTDSEELNFRTDRDATVFVPTRALSTLTRFGRLMEDLEVLQGIRVARFLDVADGESESESDENSFSELMLAVETQVTKAAPRNIVEWLAESFRQLRKTRPSSIDGIIMLHEASRAAHAANQKRQRMRWNSLRSQRACETSKSSNVFARLLKRWRRPKAPTPQPSFLINRLLKERFSNYF
ncbi:hypothetical protein METBIDRAFT_102154 [Metschnikowia bicuspidata var. bicuspidata NRRL YB-4993]|uniref:Uncharacterized protein n=1 Tax=Metschnikowia bicuspidata var. bicuspidata NRRL YB-4993 TaxID=869754 RepID=A0A1A0HGD6_9ASCO|nr:hypothetical protein METBIDRAFT_102154 [Metschnikowia bicuspidata var. bicuspidata NRRL YB-4993]OBA23229.1 hypothetical protein METBIDRAFT_102154 [Metschnikowia bicuspidata var. bicuspidata NRRL YB-4993]